MPKRAPIPAPEHSPLDALPVAAAQRDPDLVDAGFAPEADVIVHGVSGWTWTGSSERQAGWKRLLDSVPDLTYVPERRYLSPEMHSEEGRVVGSFAPADAASGAEPFDISIRMIARISEDRVTRLEVWGDASALPTALRPLVTGGAAAVGSMASLRGLHPPSELRVLGTAHDTRGPAAAAAGATQGAAVAAPAEPSESRRRRRVLVAGLLTLVVLGVLGAIVVLRGGATPEPQDTAVASASPAPRPSAAATEPAPPVEASLAVPEIADEAPSAAPQVQAGEQLVLASDVLFETGSAVLSPQAVQALTDLSRTIRDRQVSGTIQINGYTDNTGSDALDLELSRARALAVAQVLQPELAGVPVRLEPQGFGKADPVADNGTPEGRAKNRRVTVVLPQ